MKLIPAFALDLTTNDVDGRAWNIDEKEMRERAMAKLKAEEKEAQQTAKEAAETDSDDSWSH